MLKFIKGAALFLVFAFPLVYIGGFVYPGIFPRAIFAFFICELLFFLFLWHSLSRREVVVKKSYITLALLFYVLVLFLGAILGADFGQSFWSSFFRMIGVVTWLHYLSFLLVVSSVFVEEKDWRGIFRAILFSGLALALVSILGVDGFRVSLFSGIEEGGSLFGNTSYSGAYYLLVFFLSFIGYSLESKRLWKGIYLFALAVIFFNPDLFNFHSLLGAARASSLVLWGGILVILFLFLLHKFTNKKVVMIASASILLLGMSVSFYSLTSIMNGEGKIYEAYVKESGLARPLVWDIAKEGIKDRPILGFGPENFSYAYQEYLNPKIITVEQSTEWFDNPHNFTLEQLLETGLVGGILLFAIFILVIFKSFQLYRENGKFYFLIIPFILLFHFFQMQTFFQTDSTLFLVFILLAFLVSHEKNKEFQIPWYLSETWPKLVLIALFALFFYFFVYTPAHENLLISKILTNQNRADRLNLEKRLCCLSINPAGSLRTLADNFMDNTGPRVSLLEKAGVTKNVREEYQVYLDIYKKYLPRFGNNYRYLVDYINIINTAFMFGIGELREGERLAHQALEISTSYPHIYWLLGVNLYYQGNSEEAMMWVQKSLDLDPDLVKSKEVYEALQARSKIKKVQFFYPDI